MRESREKHMKRSKSKGKEDNELLMVRVPCDKGTLQLKLQILSDERWTSGKRS